MTRNNEDAREIASLIVGMRRDLRKALRKPQLANSSIEDGAVNVYDGSGQLQATVGKQDDGTWLAASVAGPIPPTPSDPLLATVMGGITVAWDGQFAGGPTVVAPLDFAGVEVYVSAELEDLQEPLTSVGVRGTRIVSARGGDVFVPWAPHVDLYARLATRTLSGKISAATPIIGPIQSGKVGIGDLGFDVETLSGTTVHYGPDEPTGQGYGDLWLKETDPGPPAVHETYRWVPGSPDSWALLADQTATQALADAIAAQQAADSKARVFHQDDEPVWLGPDGSAVWFDTGDGNRKRAWNGTAFVDQRLGNGAIEPASLVASDVIATGTVTASLLEAIMVLTTTLIAGPDGVAGPHVNVSGLGLRLYDVDPDGTVVQSGGMGTGEDGWNLIDPATGQTNVSLTRDGAIAGITGSFAGVDADGDGIADSGFQVYGRELADLLGSGGEGPVASGFLNNAAGGVFASGITTRFGLGEIAFTAKARRNYLMIFEGLHFAMTGGTGRALVTIRGTTDDTTPTISNGLVYGSKFVPIPAADTAVSAPPIIVFGGFSDTFDIPVRLLVTVERFTGTGTVSALTYTSSDAHNAPYRFFSIGVGTDIPDVWIPNDGGGVRAGGNPSATPKKTYTSAWTASFVGSYLGNGSRRTDTTSMYQGQTPHYTANGNQKAIAGFMGGATQGELGKTIATALAGATIQKVEIALRCNHSHYNGGGTAVIGYHGNTSLPATAPASAYGAFGNASFDRGQTRWMTLPSSTHASWQNGTYRGITVGPGPSTDPQFYCVFDGSTGTKPAVRITYTR